MKSQELVHIDHKEVKTTSRIIAESFGKKHKNILQAIENLECSKEFTELNFQPSSYKDKSGKINKEYFITKDGFSFLVMGFTGIKAAEWKEKYIKAFNKMEKALLKIAIQQQNNEWLEQRNTGKIARKEETDMIKEFVEYAIAQGSQSAKFYYSTITKMQYKALFIIEGKFENIRDLMSGQQLQFQAVCDEIVRKALRKGMDEGLHYREIFQLAKRNIEQFAELMPKSNIPQIKELI